MTNQPAHKFFDISNTEGLPTVVGYCCPDTFLGQIADLVRSCAASTASDRLSAAARQDAQEFISKSQKMLPD